MLDVPVIFHFKVEFGANSSDQDNRFQEVTGLNAEVTVEELKEGDLNQYVHKLPNGCVVPNAIHQSTSEKIVKFLSILRGTS